ncbi:hypothetical protein OKW30_007932 [Paraburkholderia sp. Clong3]
MHLLQAGVPFNVIALWLGHESPMTTHRYVEADLPMKEKALGRLEAPDARIRRYQAPDALIRFLVNGGRNPTLDGGVGQPGDAIAVQPGDSGTFHEAHIRVRRREPVGRAQTHRGCSVRQGDDAGIGMR